ncbi:MAG: FecR domain-containing protein [Deltaproteobacteria bacterium]|nr:FecR domain-containing protein [Deltaproteobacteria bacterium]
MKQSIRILSLLPALVVSLFLTGNAHAKPPGIPLAQVSQLEGEAWWILDESGKQPLSNGSLLQEGYCIETGEGARLAMVFHDGCVIRLDAHTKAVLTAEKPEASNPDRSVRVTLEAGDLWGFVMKRTAENDTVTVLTQRTMAAVDECVFRIQVLANLAVILKVYRGELLASGLPSLEEQSTSKSESKANAPPLPQTPWRHQILPMRELIVRWDGSATNPFRFAAKADRCKWVLWNQALDAAYLPNPE